MSPRSRRPIASLLSLPARLASEEAGATLLEYALLIALIAAVVIAVITILDQKANNVFTTVSNTL